MRLKRNKSQKNLLNNPLGTSYVNIQKSKDHLPLLGPFFISLSVFKGVAEAAIQRCRFVGYYITKLALNRMYMFRENFSKFLEQFFYCEIVERGLFLSLYFFNNSLKLMERTFFSWFWFSIFLVDFPTECLFQ